METDAGDEGDNYNDGDMVVVVDMVMMMMVVMTILNRRVHRGHSLYQHRGVWVVETVLVMVMKEVMTVVTMDDGGGGGGGDDPQSTFSLGLPSPSTSREVGCGDCAGGGSDDEGDDDDNDDDDDSLLTCGPEPISINVK